VISSRYAPAVLVMVALALVPTLIHSYAGLVVQDGRRATNLPSSLAGLDSRASDRNATWGQRRFESDDWIERVYQTSAGKATLTVIRSYDLKALYHHPELAVAYGTNFASHRVEMVGTSENMPVHVLTGGRASGPLALYALHYGDRFVSNPIQFQLRTAGELLFLGRRAMTLFFVRAEQAGAADDVSKQPALVILLAAIDSFTAQAAASAR
jgi:hypothetical protein